MFGGPTEAKWNGPRGIFKAGVNTSARELDAGKPGHQGCQTTTGGDILSTHHPRRLCFRTALRTDREHSCLRRLDTGVSPPGQPTYPRWLHQRSDCFQSIRWRDRLSTRLPRRLCFKTALRTAWVHRCFHQLDASVLLPGQETFPRCTAVAVCRPRAPGRAPPCRPGTLSSPRPDRLPTRVGDFLWNFRKEALTCHA